LLSGKALAGTASYSTRFRRCGLAGVVDVLKQIWFER
jgi:hypothetical protein